MSAQFEEQQLVSSLGFGHGKNFNNITTKAKSLILNSMLALLAPTVLTPFPIMVVVFTTLGVMNVGSRRGSDLLRLANWLYALAIVLVFLGCVALTVFAVLHAKEMKQIHDLAVSVIDTRKFGYTEIAVTLYGLVGYGWATVFLGIGHLVFTILITEGHVYNHIEHHEADFSPLPFDEPSKSASIGSAQSSLEKQDTTKEEEAPQDA